MTTPSIRLRMPGNVLHVEQLADGDVLVRDGLKIVGKKISELVSDGYSNPAYPDIGTVSDALDTLLFVPMSASITGGSAHENGESVASVSLSWSYNKAISSQSLSGSGTTPPSTAQRFEAATGPFTSNQTFTISGTSADGSETVVASTTLSFLDKRYWGASALTSLADADIIALSSELATSRVQSRTLTPSGQYLYFAWPSSFGTPTFVVNGLVNTAWSKTAVTFTNAHGYATSYDVWRSDNLLTATYDVDVS